MIINVVGKNDSYPITNLGNLEIPNTEIQIKNEKVLRCKRVRIKPTPKQRNLLKKWIHFYRIVYNKTVNFLKNNEITSFYNLRKIIKNSFSHSFKKAIKKIKIPSHTIDNAIHDVLKALKTAKTLKRKGLIKSFILRYKKNRKPKQTLTLEASCFSKNHPTFCIRALGRIIPGFKPFIGKARDSKLQYDNRSGEFWLFMPFEKETKELHGRKICALDPGIRTFQTGYNKEKCFELELPMSKIMNLKKSIEKKAQCKHKKWYKKFERRKYDKIKHIVEDNHWKIANLLVKNYETIIIGKLSTRSIVSKDGNLNKDNRSLAMLCSHYTFRQRLITKAEEFNAKVIELDESMTTKTCGNCGIRNDPKKSKTYHCNSCNFTWGRDFNAARNIMIKCLE